MSDIEEPTFVSPSDAKGIQITDIPKNTRLEISTIGKDGIHYIELEGTLGWDSDKFCIFMSYNWYRKYWDSPLGLSHHMDLMKRLAEFRQVEHEDIYSIEFLDEGDWCHLYFTIIPPNNPETLDDVYQYGLFVSNWINKIVNEAQEETSKLVSLLSQEYSSYKLIEIPELIKKVSVEKDSNVKGRLLEELICKLFEKIEGFEIIDRLKTQTEEIDLVIINKSQEVFWQKESQLLLVECKNWSTKCGKNELVIFKEKMLNRKGRAKIGFFISWNGFKSTFSKEDLRTSQGDMLIIPVTGKEIIEAINQPSLQKSIEKWWIKAIGS